MTVLQPVEGRTKLSISRQDAAGSESMDGGGGDWVPSRPVCASRRFLGELDSGLALPAANVSAMAG